MNKFQVGDRVKWAEDIKYPELFNDYNDTAIIIETYDDGATTVDWDHGTKYYCSFDDNFTLIYPKGYRDFQDKIKDRLGIPLKLCHP